MTTSSIAGRGNREIREMLLYIARSLVDHPDGTGGQTARALKSIAGASGRKIGRCLTLDIVPEAGRSQ